MIIKCPLCKTSITLTQGRFSCNLCEGLSWFKGTFQDGQINAYGIHINHHTLVYNNIVNKTVLYADYGKVKVQVPCQTIPHPDTLDITKVINTINRLLNLKVFI